MGHLYKRLEANALGSAVVQSELTFLRTGEPEKGRSGFMEWEARGTWPHASPCWFGGGGKRPTKEASDHFAGLVSSSSSLQEKAPVIFNALRQGPECACIHPFRERLVPFYPVFCGCWPVASMLGRPVGSVSR